MKDRDAFLFIFAIFFVTLGVWALGLESQKVAAVREQNLRAAAYGVTTKANPKIANSEKASSALTSFTATKYPNQNFSPKTVTGTLYVIHEDKKDPDENGNIYKAYVKGAAGLYEIKNISYLPFNPKQNGAKVTFSGLTSGKKNSGATELFINMSQNELKSLKGAKQTKRYGSSRSATCQGNFCAIVFPIDTTGGVASLPARTDIENYIFSGRIKTGFTEESFGALDYGGTVTDWIQVSSPNVNIWQAPAEVAQYISANGINLSSYNQVVFLVNGGPVSNGGLASVGAGSLDVGGIQYNIPVARVGFSQYQNNADLTMANGNLSYFDHLYMHETMHNLGAIHDNLANCKSGPLSLPSECIFVEYGNNLSTMGGGYLGAHPSFLNKLRMGWINATNITLSNSGTFNLRQTELTNPAFVGVDYGLNGTPEYIFEKRNSAGLDTTTLFPNTNLNGALTYRLFPDYGFNIPADPYQWNLNLVDTTPATNSNGWPSSLYDAVLKIPQRYVDAPRAIGFRQNASGNNSVIDIYSAPATTCQMKPIKVFEPADASDSFAGQVGIQKWPIASAGTTGTAQTIHGDVSDPSAQILLYKTIMIFNDDNILCAAGDYTFKLKFNGTELPLVSDTGAQYPAWGGPYYQTVFAYLPTYGLTYGNQTVTLEVTKLNDGTIFSKDLKFNLAP